MRGPAVAVAAPAAARVVAAVVGLERVAAPALVAAPARVVPVAPPGEGPAALAARIAEYEAGATGRPLSFVARNFKEPMVHGCTFGYGDIAMSVNSFMIDAGEKLIAAPDPVPPGVGAAIAASAPTEADLNAVAGAVIAQRVAANKLKAQNLQIVYDGASKTVTVKGIAPDQATKEKIILCCGNVHSVAAVDDQLTVAQNSAAYPPSTGYEVKAGETLSDIAAAVYGDAGSYETILEANKPMLKEPNQIYPGQRLRIPPKA